MIAQAVMARKIVHKWKEVKRRWESYYRLTAVYSRISEVLEMGIKNAFWVCGSMVEHILCVWKALTSIPITLQRKEAVTQRNHVLKT